MSQLLSVPQSEWRPFFDRMSKALLGKWAEIDVASLDLGDQIVARMRCTDDLATDRL